MFTLVPESQFGKHLFDRHPVWARFDEPDDVEVIVSWGINRAALLKQLEELHDGSDHAMYPVLQTDPLLEYPDVYVRAECLSPDGYEFTGCLQGVEALSIVLFFGASLYPFLSNGLSDLNLETLRRLRTDLGNAHATIFPLTYRTGFRKADGASLAGLFAAKL
jgi:hypothetical protein